MDRDSLTERVIGCAIAVHRELGPGLLESIYEEAMGLELAAQGVSYLRQIELPVSYKGMSLNGSFRVDMLVEGAVVLELKCVDTLLPVHKAQLRSYLRLGGWTIGLLLNFKTAVLKNGIYRMSI